MKRTESRLMKSKMSVVLVFTVSLFLVTATRAGSLSPMQQQNTRSSQEQKLNRQGYEMTFRSYIDDPAGGALKRIEIRYRNGNLEELIVDGKIIARSDYSGYSQIIKQAESEGLRAKKEIEGASAELDQARKEIEAAALEMEKAMTEFDSLREEMWKAIEALGSEKDGRWMSLEESDPVSPEKREKMLRRLEELEKYTTAGRQI
ncbi:MAG: hypothetical protein IH591_20850 [Bacteroidales bacterium]|nr:hypothetical protein [Bacteroidales bacterium]